MLYYQLMRLKNLETKAYGLSPAHYLSVPALSWNAMLNTKKLELELISYAGIYLLFEKDMRGGGFVHV